MTFVKGVSGNPTGKLKGNVSVKTVVKKTLAEKAPDAIEEMWNIIQGLKNTDVVQYLDRMEVLLPYMVSKKPAETNLTVSNGHIDTSELKELSLDAKRKILEIVQSENKTLLLD